MKTAWMENHRVGVTAVWNAISTVIWLVSLFAVRTLVGAGAILAYFFYTASPETTMYQLSQMAHGGVFWQLAFCIAFAYSAMLMAIHGSISGGRVVAARAGGKVGHCAKTWKEVDRSPHPEGGDIVTYASQDKKD